MQKWRNESKRFSYYKNSRDGNINPEEILTNQINFKSDLSEIKKANPNVKLKDQISVIQNVENIFDLREKTIDFFRDYSFLLSEAKYEV